MPNTEYEVSELLKRQYSNWSMFHNSIDKLADVEVREFKFNGFSVFAQHNPARAISTQAKVDAASIKNRKCFLCSVNRPEEQEMIPVLDGFSLLVNPFPILSGHLTVCCNSHTPQSILGNSSLLLQLAGLLPNHVVFYNGPQCGASAPDHLHFQAVLKGQLPIERDYKNLSNTEIYDDGKTRSYQLGGYLRQCTILESEDCESCNIALGSYLNRLATKTQQEPMVNIFACVGDGVYRAFCFNRKAHRPKCYIEDAPKQLIVSPGAIDMAGVFVLPRKEDFEKINEQDIVDIYGDVSAL